MILYGSSFSPYVRKVIVFAGERGVELDVRNVMIGSDDPGFVAASPLRKMPALVDGDFSLADSTAIVTYLDAVAPGAPMIPVEPRQRGLTYWWDEFADTELFRVAVKMFFNRVVSPLFLRRPGDLEVGAIAERDELPPLLDYLERSVPDRGWLVGDCFGLADVALGSLFVNLAHCAAPLDPTLYPRLVDYIARVHARSSFAGLIAQETKTLARVRKAA